MTWQSMLLPNSDPNGNPIISIIAKRTYSISQGNVEIAGEQIPLTTETSIADPMNPLYSETIAETDIIGYKLNTDIVVLGNASVPRGKRAYHLDCGIQIGTLQKIIRVFGDRKVESKALRGLCFTDPSPFESMPISYHKAFGGLARSKDGALMPFPPNPIGKGFYLKGGFDDYSEIQVPNLEDPSFPIEPDQLIVNKYEEWESAPAPVSLGWTKQSFYPRWTYLGVLPEFLAGAIQENTRPDVKIQKMDYRFYQGASEGLNAALLNGNEHVRLTHLDPDFPVFEFDLPNDIPQIILTSGNDKNQLSPVLQTVLIDKNNNTLQLVWRGSFPYGGIDELEKISFTHNVE